MVLILVDCIYKPKLGEVLKGSRKTPQRKGNGFFLRTS
jgi:hypothetical protein